LLLKLAVLAVLAVTDGAESLTVAALYFAGIALLLLGSPAVGLALTRARPRAVRVVAAVLSPLAVFVSFALLDGSVKPLLENSGPSWIHEEWGILATALLWLAVGGALRRRDLEPATA